MDKDTTYKIRLNSQLKQTAHTKARKQGRKLSDVIREFLQQWVEPKEKPPP